MNTIIQSVISGVLICILTLLINAIWAQIKEKRASPKWQKQLTDLEDRLSKQHQELIEKMNKNEMSNIKTEITLFHSDRRNEQKMNSEEYKWLIQAHSRYKELGGNSYEDAIFKDIMDNWKVE